MSIPITDVAVCNLALDHLKQAPIVNIEAPTTQVEERMARQYSQARRAVLRMHPWNFAAYRVALTASSDYEPAVGYTHAFRKPNDFIRFLHRLDADGLPLISEYDLEGDYILMDVDEATPTIYIRYIRDITDVSKWDPLFLDLVALTLAIRVAPNFSGSEARAKALREMAEMIKADARAIDGQERPPRIRERSKFIQARRGFRSSGNRDQRYVDFG